MPFAGHLETQVVETRIFEDADFICRRQCGACERRFTTYERPAVNFPAFVKKDGRRTAYQHSKILDSMTRALRKRPVSTEQVDLAVEQIEEKLLNLGLREVASSCLGDCSCWNLRSSTRLRISALSAFTGVLRILMSLRRWWMRSGGSQAAQ
jgi:transcriptional repressor NrdR